MTRTLLLADDNITTHRIVALTFAEHDIRVISAVDGVEAIERIERDRPDIILADANLTRIDGYELAQYVTARPSLAGVPVLLLAGAFDTIDEGRVKQSGAAGVIVKPFEPADVINRVKALLGFGDKPAVPAPVALPSPPVAVEPPPVAAVLTPRSPRPVRAVPAHTPRNGPVAVPPAADAHLPAAPAAWDQLRRESRPGADGSLTDGHSGAAQDYFERLDAAFDTLDAQLAGRLPNRPASARRDAGASFGEAGSASARRDAGASFGEAGSASARRDAGASFGEAGSASARRDTGASFGGAGSASARGDARASFGEGEAPFARGDTRVRSHEAEPDSDSGDTRASSRHEDLGSTQRDVRPGGGTTHSSRRPHANPPETLAADTTDPPVFEVDADWFAELPADNDDSPLSSGPSQPLRMPASRPVLVTSSGPVAPEPVDTPRAVAAPAPGPAARAPEADRARVAAEDRSPAVQAVPPEYRTEPSAPNAPAAPAALGYRTRPGAADTPDAPVAPEYFSEPTPPEASSAATPEHRAAARAPDPPAAPVAPESSAPAAPDAAPSPVAAENRDAPFKPAAPEHRTAPRAPDGPRAPAAPEHRLLSRASQAPPAPVARDASAPPVLDAPAAPVAPVTLGDLFDALLAAEERRDQRAAPVEVVTVREPQGGEISDAVIDRIALRVAERLADGVLIDAVRNGVAAITERLVRDEIERTRTHPQRKT